MITVCLCVCILCLCVCCLFVCFPLYLSVLLTLDNGNGLKELHSRAQGEVSIREALKELELWGASTTFSLTNYSDSANKELSIIKDWKDLVNQVGDNQCLLQSLKDSPYFEGFADKASLWETRLAELDEYLHSLNQIQRRWVYLEPIFGRGALPREQARFKRVDGEFRSIMKDIAKDERVLSVLNVTGIRQSLGTLLDQLGRCQKALNEFLEVCVCVHTYVYRNLCAGIRWGGGRLFKLRQCNVPIVILHITLLQ